jgi:hypothetical protein
MRVGATVVFLLACGCGRIHFDPRDDAAFVDTDAAVDTARIGPPLCGMPFGQWAISAPVALDDINNLLIAQLPPNGDQDEFDPAFSEDGLSLYFTSDQTGPFQVWVATRPSLTAPFDAVALLGSDVNAATNSIFGFQPLASLSRAIVSAPYTGSIGGTDFWLGTQTTGTWSWAATSLSTSDGDNDARLTADGLVVYFPLGPGDGRDIYRARRGNVSTDFGAPVLVPELNSTRSDSSPLPVRDGIFVVRDKPGMPLDDDVWYAANDGSGGFQTLFPLDELNTDAFDGEPAYFEMSGSCELVLASTRSGAFNLYRSLVTRL